MKHDAKFRIVTARSMPSRSRRSEQGIILFVTLISLLILMITGIALVKSFDSSLLLSGNIAFKRDLVNQGERGIAAAINAFDSTSGALYTDAQRQATSTTNNYSSTTLTSDGHGIPQILTGAAAWNMSTTNDIYDATSKVTIRYVIDRMCSATGAEATTDCIYLNPKVTGGDNREQRAAPATQQILYRISVRVTLPNNTQTFIQTTGFR